MRRYYKGAEPGRRIALMFLLAVLFCGGCGEETESYSYFSLSHLEEEDDKDPGRTIILTHSQAEDNPVHETAEEFKNQLELLSDGRYEVKIYPANSYGQIAGGYSAVGNGTIEMRIGGNSGACANIISWLPAFLDISPEDVAEGLKEGGNLYNKLEKECREDGCHLLGVLAPSYRVLTSNLPVNKLDDFVGLNIRITNHDVETIFWSALAVDGNTAYDFDTLYTALQMELVDAEENPVEVIYSRRFYEQQKYLIKTNHRMQMNSIFVSLDFWDNLSQEDQEIFKKAATAAVQTGDKYAEEKRNTYWQVMKDNMEILEFPDSEKEKMRQTAGAAVREWMELNYEADLVKEIIEAVR